MHATLPSSGSTDIDACAPVLVVGPTFTEDGYQALRSYARTVADQTGTPATFASHDDYRTTDFSAVYVAPLEWEADDTAPLVLIAEALAAGVPVHTPQGPADAMACELCEMTINVHVEPGHRGDVLCGQCRFLDLACAHCGEDADHDDYMEVVEADETWVFAHKGCVAEGRRVHGPDAFVSD
ncbi:hypothetical protein GT352_20165 [Streptomyces sp. SID1046]|uniref:hypothetical protein n=1 Tax=Streptomyces sp. SID1046 TaxID=2690249 RepID=UPI00136857FE|nr:hypothetical protein [Streptomyces sp. SID1046]MYV76228.1 hypothetical protein [Streptomyces sp. SID1046]